MAFLFICILDNVIELAKIDHILSFGMRICARDCSSVKLMFVRGDFVFVYSVFYTQRFYSSAKSIQIFF